MITQPHRTSDFYEADGHMESEITAYDVDNEKWNEGLTDLVNTDSAVTLNFSVSHEYF